MCTSNSHHTGRHKSSWLCAFCCCCVLCAAHIGSSAAENIGDLPKTSLDRNVRHAEESAIASLNDSLKQFEEALHLNLTEYKDSSKKCLIANPIFHATPQRNLTELFKVLQQYEDKLEWKVCQKQSDAPPPPLSYLKWEVWLYTFLSVTVISLTGLVAVALIPLMHQAFYHILIQFLISLAVGSLIGDALLHLIPHALFPHDTTASHSEHDHDHAHDDHSHSSPSHTHRGPISHQQAIYMTIMAVGGVLVFFIAERIVIVYQMWRAKSKYPHEVYAAEDMEDAHSGDHSKHSSEAKERSSDYRTALNSHNSELEENRYSALSAGDAHTAAVVPLVQVISSSKPLLTASLPKISDSGLAATVSPGNGDVINGGHRLLPPSQLSSSAQMSPSKKHRLGWGCVQHAGALSAIEPVPQHVSHSAELLFCGNCNQPPLLQTRTDCNDPMDEESCLKGRRRRSNSNSKDIRGSMPFLTMRNSEHDGESDSHKLVATDEAPMLHDTNHHAHVKTHDQHQHHSHSHEVEIVGHCHGQGHQSRNARPHSHHHGHSHDLSSVRSIAYTILAGDGLHNFCDGIAIGAAFAGGDSDGLAVSLAVLCHELPHELGDFAVLLHAGIPVRSAIYYNVFSSILCYIGAIIGVVSGSNPASLGLVFMFTAGMFLYIALVDMVPELTTQRLRGNQFFTNPVCLLCIHSLGIVMGGAMMLGIALSEDKF